MKKRLYNKSLRRQSPSGYTLSFSLNHGPEQSNTKGETPSPPTDEALPQAGHDKYHHRPPLYMIQHEGQRPLDDESRLEHYGQGQTCANCNKYPSDEDVHSHILLKIVLRQGKYVQVVMLRGY